MDRRRRTHSALVALGDIQRLQLAQSRAVLADAVGALVAAQAETHASRACLVQCDVDFEAALAGTSFDPEAMRRASWLILDAEDSLASTIAAETRAETEEAENRRDWHHSRLRSEFVDDRRRRSYRKLMQVAEDKAAIERAGLPTHGNRGS